MKVILLLALVGAAAALSEWEMQPEVEMQRRAPVHTMPHLSLGALEHALGGFLGGMMREHHHAPQMMMHPHHPMFLHLMQMPHHPMMMPMHPHMMMLPPPPSMMGMLPPPPPMMMGMHPHLMILGHPLMRQHLMMPPLPPQLLREAAAEHKPLVIHFIGMPHPMGLHPMHVELIRRRAPEAFRALGHEHTPLHQIPQGDLQKALAPLGHLLRELPSMLQHSLGGLEKVHIPSSFGGLRLPAFLQHLGMPVPMPMPMPEAMPKTADANTQTYESVSYENGRPHGVVKRVEDVDGEKKVFMQKVDGAHSLREAEDAVRHEQAADEAARDILAKLAHH